MGFDPKQVTDVLGSEEVKGVLTDVSQVVRETRSVIDTIFGTAQSSKSANDPGGEMGPYSEDVQPKGDQQSTWLMIAFVVLALVVLTRIV